MTSAVLVPILGGHTLVDEQDVDLAVRYRWTVTGTGRNLYAVGTVGRATTSLHRLIAQTPPGLYTDHANRDTLDNRRSNLRWATPAQNSANTDYRPRPGSTSQYKGVSWNRSRNLWHASINDGPQPGRRSNLRRIGYYTDESEAARAYDAAAREVFGEFAYLNFPE